MKINFKNLGPIKEATIELGKFTLVAGGNNCGKTYLTYAIYGLLDSWWNFLTLEKVIRPLVEKETKVEKFTININDLNEEQAFKSFGEEFTKTLAQVFSAKKDTFSETLIDIEPPKPSIEYLINNPYRISVSNVTLNASIDTNGTITVKTEFKEPTQSYLHTIIYIDFALKNFLYRHLFPSPHISTSERLGIALFYKELDATRSVLVEKLQELANSTSTKKNQSLHQLVEKEASRFSKPTKDNIEFVRDLENVQKKSSELPDSFKREVLGYITQMLGGKYKVEDQSITFSNNKKGSSYSVPLHLGSSSVRSLMDIFFYLKHTASNNELLMIDEPEGHLTPQNQIILTRLLAACINNGINIFITTHSDYIVKELNNLIMLGSLEVDLKEKYLSKKNPRHKIIEQIKPSEIKAYTCGKGGLQPCHIDRFGITVSNIDEAIESINTSSAELFDLLNR